MVAARSTTHKTMSFLAQERDRDIMNLTKNEAKYRIRLMQENHYTKEEQQEIDVAIKNQNLSYKRVYSDLKNGLLYFFILEIGVRRATKAFQLLGSSFATLERATSCFNQNLI